MTFPAQIHAKSTACQICVATPPGRGAVATILVHGPQAIEIVNRLFQSVSGRPLNQVRADRILLGTWRSQRSSSPGEQLVVRPVADDQVEVHCHGGQAAVKQIVASLVAQGCRQVEPSDWLFSRQPDRIAAEAHLALTRARTWRVAAILLAQQQGALDQAIASIQTMIHGRETQRAIGRLQALQASAKFGRRLIDPWRIVVAGPANAGKSSLVNALLGYRRSIVHAVPGTTRDVLSADAAIDGWPVQIVDTAGLNRSVDPLESAGILLAKRQFDLADLLLWVTDVTQPGHPRDAEIVSRPQSDRLLIHNKVDLASPLPARRATGFCVSAKGGDGIPQLLTTISQHLVPDPPAPGAAVPFQPRHERAISEALDHLQDNRPREASSALRALQLARQPLSSS